MTKEKTLAQQMQQYNEDRRKLDDSVLRGDADAPPCFTCKAPSAFVTDRITPAGYRAYQCAAHAPKNPEPLWGSDAGWQTKYIPLREARAEAA